jgi:predicted double-glycine peptidase
MLCTAHWLWRQAGTLALFLASVSLFPAPARSQSWENEGVQGAGKNIRSLKEIRGEAVIRQKWDMSCGAAALSTLLTYDFKDNTPESAIVVWILHRVDPVRVRARGGFSLLDLKRFSQARGYSAEGFTGMSIEELASQKTSVIVPIRLKGFDHFIVIRQIVDGRVIVADPGFGNLTMRVDRFQSLWKEGIVFVVHPPTDLMLTEKRPVMASRLVPDETMIQRRIGVVVPSNPLN